MEKNSSILTSLWLDGVGDYAQRVPSPTVATQAQTMKAIFDPGTGAWNLFTDGLINRIGMTYAKSRQWKSPLNIFLKGDLEYGTSVQELQTKWIRGHAYLDDAETLLKVHRPEVVAAYHEMNRQDQYPISVNRTELRGAFMSEYGLNSYIQQVMDAPLNAEQYDLYRQMLETIRYADDAWGIFKIHGDEPTDETSSKAFLKSLRAMTERLRFPSSRYNAGVIDDIPVFVNDSSELVLLCTPEAAASVDVDTLASVFHLDMARDELEARRIIVDEFPVPGAFAMLTTKDFFQVYNVDYSNSSFYNPQTLTTTYYLTVMQIISASPFVPCIIWTTEDGTETGTITQTVETNQTSIAAFIRNACSGCLEAVTGSPVTVPGADAIAGRVYVRGTALSGTLSDGTVTGAERIGEVTVAPDAVVLTITGATAGGAQVALNSRSYFDRNGRLHLQAALKRALDSGDVVLQVSALPTYLNPDGDTPAPQATTMALTISQLAGGGEPEPEPLEVTFYVNGTAVTDGFSETVTETSLELSVMGSALSDSATAVATVGGTDHAMTLSSGPGGNSYVYTAEYAGAETAIKISVTDGGASASISGTVAGS